MFVRLYSTYPSEIRDVARHGSSPNRFQVSEAKWTPLTALPAMNTSAVRATPGSRLSTNAVALNAAPNAAPRSGNFFLVQRTRFPALLEMILWGIGKTHF